MVGPTVLQKTDKMQIRIELSNFKDRRLVNIREYAMVNGEYIPTKKGITCTPELIQPLAEAILALKPKTVKQVVHVDTPQTGYSVARTSEDASFLKKHFYGTLEEAKSKSPPDGYYIFKLLIKEGVVVKTAKLAKRKDSKWIKIA